MRRNASEYCFWRKDVGVDANRCQDWVDVGKPDAVETFNRPRHVRKV